MLKITHITLATGHTAVTARRDVSDNVLMRLQSVIDAEAGAIVEAGVYIDLIRPIDPITHRPYEGTAAFTILSGSDSSSIPITQCVICWRDELAVECWQMAEAMQAALLPQSPRTKMPAKIP